MILQNSKINLKQDNMAALEVNGVPCSQNTLRLKRNIGGNKRKERKLKMANPKVAMKAEMEEKYRRKYEDFLLHL